MTNWYNDHGMSVLIGQVKAEHPGMTVYTIGDEAHQREKSDHNPNAHGAVCAADFMIGTHFTFADAQELYNALTHYADHRLKYVIFNRVIWEDGKPSRYTGSNPHTDHVHVSVHESNDTSEWNLGQNLQHTASRLDGYGIANLKYGMNDDDYAGPNMVTRLQLLLNAGLTIDGVYGDKTAEVVKARCGGDGKTVEFDEWRKLLGLDAMVKAT